MLPSIGKFPKHEFSDFSFIQESDFDIGDFLQAVTTRGSVKRACNTVIRSCIILYDNSRFYDYLDGERGKVYKQRT